MSRRTAVSGLGNTISPPLDRCARNPTPRSMSTVSFTGSGINGTPTDGDASSSAPKSPLFDARPCATITPARVVVGAVALSNSSHFDSCRELEVAEASHVADGPREALDQAAADRIDDLNEHHRDGARRLPQRSDNRRAVADDHVRLERH